MLPLWGKHEPLEEGFCLSGEGSRGGEVIISGPEEFASSYALKKAVVQNCPSYLCSETTSQSFLEDLCLGALGLAVFCLGCRSPVTMCLYSVV